MLDRILILSTAMMGAVAGCGQPQAPNPQKIDAAVWNSPHSGLVGHEQPVLVAEGNVPLVFQALHESPFHVADQGGGVITRGWVNASGIIRVDASGIYVGGNQLAGQTLARDQHYQIYIDPITAGP